MSTLHGRETNLLKTKRYSIMVGVAASFLLLAAACGGDDAPAPTHSAAASPAAADKAMEMQPGAEKMKATITSMPRPARNMAMLLVCGFCQSSADMGCPGQSKDAAVDQ